MSFIVSNLLYHSCSHNLPQSFLKLSDRVTFGFDATLITGISLLCGLVIANVIHIWLPAGAGAFASLAPFGLGGAAALALLNGVTAFIKWKRGRSSDPQSERELLIRRDCSTNERREVREVSPVSAGSLKTISGNTLQLVEQGYYSTEAGRFELQTGLDLHNKSRLFKYDDQNLQPVMPRFEDQLVFIMVKDSLEAAQFFVEKNRTVAVLNFAGPEEVGGGFLDGTAGQEEKLIYRSDFAALMKYYHDEQDKEHPVEAYPLYNHLMHTADVTVFRNSSFEPLSNPFKVGILTSAAPVPNPAPGISIAPTGFDISITSEGVEYADKTTEEVLKKIIFTQLKTAYDLNYQTIILGAFGCGAFRNPPQVVARVYHEVIDMYFKGAFKEIVFAILDGGRQSHNPNGNIAPFETYFS